MSKPRQIIPGSTYLITRRTSGRKYLLKPVPIVGQIFGYCLAHAANKYNIQVHAYCVMSNHYHMVATDPDGTLPAFMSWLNEFVAKALNVAWERWEYFWAPNTYSAVRLETSGDIIDKIIYTLANPVKSFLVSDSGNWPGITSRSNPFGAYKKFSRPKVYFKKNGALPKNASLQIQVPAGFEDSAVQFKTRINKHLKIAEAEIKRTAIKENRHFFGAAAATKVGHNDRPFSCPPRRNLNPQVASKHGPALKAAIFRLKKFRAEYALARENFDRGETSTNFPFGTYALHKHVTVESIPPPEMTSF